MIILLVLVVCFGSVIYTSVSGSSSPITVAVGTVATPVQKAITWVADRFVGLYNFIFRYQDALDENGQLKEEIRDLEQQLRDAQYAVDENESLRQMLEIKERNRDFQFAIAEVVARSAGNWSYTLSLDKGSAAGIEVDDCVITEDGMVGYVSEVGPNYAEVTTVLDPAMQAGAIVTRTREVAVAEGDFDLMEDETLKLAYLTRDAEAIIGDTVETSGTGGIFPKGLLIGTIESIQPEDHGMSNYAVIEPAVDISAVKRVYVITDFDVTD